MRTVKNIEDMPTVNDIVMSVCNVKMDDMSFKHRTSRQIMNYGEQRVLAYFVVPKALVVVIVRMKTKLVGYVVRNEPLWRWNQYSSHVTDPVSAMEFIELNGGVVLDGFDVENELEGIYGSLVEEVVVRWWRVRVYEKKGQKYFVASYAFSTLRKMDEYDIANFYRSYKDMKFSGELKRTLSSDAEQMLRVASMMEVL